MDSKRVYSIWECIRCRKGDRCISLIPNFYTPLVCILDDEDLLPDWKLISSNFKFTKEEK